MKSFLQNACYELIEALIGFILAAIMVAPFLILLFIYGCSRGSKCLF